MKEPTIQDVVNTGMSNDHIRDVVNGIATGIRTRANRDSDASFKDDFLVDVRISLFRIADALDYLVAMSKRAPHENI
jgi:hypothetical protein